MVLASHVITRRNVEAMKIKMKKLTETAVMPTRGSEYAAGYDLYADPESIGGEYIFISPHTTEKIGTGLSAEIPEGYFGAVFARSGIAAKRGLRPANAVGVIDSDYRGEIIVALHNDTDIMNKVYPGERIAQLVILPYQDVEYEEVDSLTATDRGAGGFGSTGSS